MAEHGRATIDPRQPRALGICQRCGAMVNHDQLRWQYQWGGLRLINLRILVCDTCEDAPQIQLRTIILPPDPVPVEFAVPEVYGGAVLTSSLPFLVPGYGGTDEAQSGIGFALSSPNNGANIGNMRFGSGIDSAFDGRLNKFSWQSAGSVNTSSFSFVGKNWNAPLSGLTIPSSIVESLSYSVTQFQVYAPSDQPIFPTPVSIQLQGSSDGVNWSVLYSSTIQGVAGEVFTSLSSNLTTGNFQQHRVTITGDGVHPVYMAQALMWVSNTGNNEQ